MLTIWGAPSGRLCDGLTRRSFFSAGTLGIAGLTLADVFRLRAEAGTPVRSPKSVIMVAMGGGPPHIDLYDLKPDAPEEFRGEYKPVASNVPGFDICESLPLQTKIADKLSLVRTVISHAKSHNASELMTGHALDEFGKGTKRPPFGSIVSWFRGACAMPPFVSLKTGATKFPLPEDPLYLGEAHRPFVPGYSRTIANLSLHRSVSPARLEDRKALLAALDTLRRDLDETRGTLAGVDAFTAQALDMISNHAVRDAFDVSKEPEKVRARFVGKYSGLNWLQAIRLAEAGVAVVAFDATDGGAWDLHGAGEVAGTAAQAKKNREAFRVLCHDHDQMVHAMVSELYTRGLEKNVVIVFCGEMGRTPRIKNGGRDHWDLGFALFAGGGFRTGQVIGKTSPRAEFAVDRPYTVQNLLATLYTHLGIDPTQSLKDHTGRPLALLDDVGPIAELIP
jgi:hypothetical protein